MEIAWKPQPKQEKALASTADEILYGGARGGGKTDAGIAFPLYNIENPLFRGLVIRKNSTDLGDWIDRANRMYILQGAEKKQGQFGTEFRFPSGAIIRTGHLQDESAYTKYQGHEYQTMVLEELSQISREKDYLKLKGSCRSTIGIKPQLFATTNPDDPGMDWIKRRWGIPDYPNFNKVYRKIIKTSEGDIVLEFIPAKIEDNPILLEKDKGYIKYLESLKDTDMDLYKAWRDGSWTGYGVEGSYYREHLAKAENEDRILQNLLDPLLPVHTWNDLGIADSFAIGYFQFIHNQIRIIDYDEFEGESIGDAVNRMKSKPYVYGKHYAPHDIEVRELGTGKSRKEIAAGLGVNYNVAPKLEVADGINAVKMIFSKMVFDDDKTELLRRRLRGYHKEYDDKRGIWKNKPVHDINSHGADMIRYMAVSPEPVQRREIARRKRPVQSDGIKVKMTSY